MNSLDDFLAYLHSMGWGKFIRIFWFFVFFELFRYLFIDVIMILSQRMKALITRKRRQEALQRFHFEAPLISIIIPGKNEGKHLFSLIQSLNEQTYSKIEIIVVDDGSDDHTPIIGRDLEKNGYIDLFLRNEIRGGKASAANLALRFAKGKFIVHLDADCSYNRDAIEQIILPFYLYENVGGVGGNVMIKNYDESLVTTLQAIEYVDTISIGRVVSSHLGIYRIISGAFGAFSAEVLSQIQGWDIGPGLDGDISVKIRKIGYNIKFAQKAVCLTNGPNTFRKLAKQRIRWDKSLIRFRLRKHRNVFYPNKAFSMANFISFAENITYNLVLNVKWYFYVAQMILFYSSQLEYIIIINLLLYTTTNYFKFIFFSLFRPKHGSMIYFLPYIPLMVFYFGYYLRIIRTTAYIKELFFKASYKDPWNPTKTSRHAKEMGI